MVLYQGSSKDFDYIVQTNQIIPTLEEIFRQKLGRALPEVEKSAYTNSLSKMRDVLSFSKIPDNCEILIEYNMPFGNLRIDFIIAAIDDNQNKNIIVVELKQWSKINSSSVPNLLNTYVGKASRDVIHPCDQSNTYMWLLSDHNVNVEKYNYQLHSCAYLHNLPKSYEMILSQKQFETLIKETPYFLREDFNNFSEYLKNKLTLGNGRPIINNLVNSETRPSKKLGDYVSQIIAGKKIFKLVDEQKLIYEKIAYECLSNDDKEIYIIHGGPGTGKSVLAINLLVNFLQNSKKACYVAGTSSFSKTIQEQIAFGHKKNRVKTMFKGASSFLTLEKNEIDIAIVDEAHRLRGKGAYMYFGKNQAEDIIRACKKTIFFIDDNQRIRPEDIGSVEMIKSLKEDCHVKNLKEFFLQVQFRCQGAQGFINWIEHALQIRNTGNINGWDKDVFDFKIYENPHELKNKILELDKNGFKARIVAGYAWDWNSKKKKVDVLLNDIVIKEHNFEMPWNDYRYAQTWSLKKEGINQAGCIHSCQGLEFDYVGVIIGKELKFNPQDYTLYVDKKEYKDLQGQVNLAKSDVSLLFYIQNIYRVLLTRGMKGCYVYICDDSLREYFKNLIKNFTS